MWQNTLPAKFNVSSIPRNLIRGGGGCHQWIRPNFSLNNPVTYLGAFLNVIRNLMSPALLARSIHLSFILWLFSKEHQQPLRVLQVHTSITNLPEPFLVWRHTWHSFPSRLASHTVHAHACHLVLYIMRRKKKLKAFIIIFCQEKKKGYS